MPKSVTITNHTDQVTFEHVEGNIDVYLNDMYLTTLAPDQCNERGWDELRNLENKEPVRVILERDGGIIPSWMD